MTCKVFVLAMLILIGSSCKHKQETENKPPQEVPQPQTPKPQEPKPQTPKPAGPHSHEHDHDHEDDHDHDHHGSKHHRLPPGQEKKLHGAKSARDYAPGHRKKH